MPNYSEESDLLTGGVPIPKGLLPQKFVDDATKEVDSVIGFRYITPVDLSETSVVARPVRLLLARVANNLATGRLIMAMSQNNQRQELHAYGSSLVRDAVAVLQQIASGEIILTGVPPVVLDPDNPQFTGPQIANVDAESNVEAFYDRVANPYYFYGYPGGESRRYPTGDGNLVA